MVHSHTRCPAMHFNESVHTLSYQRSPSHPIPACVWMHYNNRNDGIDSDRILLKDKTSRIHHGLRIGGEVCYLRLPCACMSPVNGTCCYYPVCLSQTTVCNPQECVPQHTVCARSIKILHYRVQYYQSRQAAIQHWLEIRGKAQRIARPG